MNDPYNLNNSSVPHFEQVNSFDYFFDQANDKLDVSKQQHSLSNYKSPYELTEEYINSNSLNVLYRGATKYSLFQVIEDYGSLPAVEKNLIRNLSKKEDIHGVYYILGVIYSNYTREQLISIIDKVGKFNAQKEFRKVVIERSSQDFMELCNFSDKEIALFYRFFTSISIETFESIGSRFNSLLNQPTSQELPQQYQQEFQNQFVVQFDGVNMESNLYQYLPSTSLSPASSSSETSPPSSPLSIPVPNYEQSYIVQQNTDNFSSSICGSIQSTPNMFSINQSPPSSPSYSQILPQSPTLSPPQDCSLTFENSVPVVKLETNANNYISDSPNEPFSSQFASCVQPKINKPNDINNSSSRKSKKVDKSKSVPKAVITPGYRRRLIGFGFSNQELERASHQSSTNYISGEKGNASMLNTMLHPIPVEVSTGRIVRSGLIITIKDVDQFPKVASVVSLFSKSSSNSSHDHFVLQKNSFTQIEPGVYHFEFSIKRIEKNEKQVAIKLNLYSDNILVDTITTPFIRFRNTPSEFSHPNDNILLRDQPYKPSDQLLPLDVDLSNYVAKEFIGVANFFKKGIKATEIAGEGDIEPILKLGKQLIIQLKNTLTGRVTAVYQDFSKVRDEDKWKFGADKNGNIINFIYSNVIEFKCIIERGTYDITFSYENVPREASPQITNYLVQ